MGGFQAMAEALLSDLEGKRTELLNAGEPEPNSDASRRLRKLNASIKAAREVLATYRSKGARPR